MLHIHVHVHVQCTRYTQHVHVHAHMHTPYAYVHCTHVHTQHSFAVSHRTLPTKADRSDFISSLQCKHLVIDVYDGDSLMFIGSANIPLKVHIGQA
jgi:hypothetical protein